jgi:hypothetical protein
LKEFRGIDIFAFLKFAAKFSTIRIIKGKKLLDQKDELIIIIWLYSLLVFSCVPSIQVFRGKQSSLHGFCIS